MPKKCGEELRGAAKARRHWRQMGTNWSERALGGWEGRVWQNMEKLWQWTIRFVFMKIGLLLVPIPMIIQTNVRASNQMKMICLYHLGTGNRPTCTSYFGKSATGQKGGPMIITKIKICLGGQIGKRVWEEEAVKWVVLRAT